ncbi:hypothetical protein ACTWP5_03820 [Streptomyces sp. 4N509B]|uniref:hypothetical protein n=1 Tax=Streptomyces sp. 4N509B TaxID=3457413 RepID=UPI003FD671CE
MKSTHRRSRVLSTAVFGAVLALGLTGAVTNTASAAERKPPTSGFRACYDLNCTKRIEEGKAFNANGDHGITRVRITRVSSSGVSLSVSGPNMSASCSGSPHLNCTINGLDIWTTSRRGDTAVFHIWP